MIRPHIGDAMLYWPGQYEGSVAGICHFAGHPMTATVAWVFSDRKVSLSVADHSGAQFAARGVTLMQGDESYQPIGAYCEWTPQRKAAAGIEPMKDEA